MNQEVLSRQSRQPGNQVKPTHGNQVAIELILLPLQFPLTYSPVRHCPCPGSRKLLRFRGRVCSGSGYGLKLPAPAYQRSLQPLPGDRHPDNPHQAWPEYYMDAIELSGYHEVGAVPGPRRFILETRGTWSFEGIGCWSQVVFIWKPKVDGQVPQNHCPSVDWKRHPILK